MAKKTDESSILTQRDSVEKIIFTIFGVILSIQIITILASLGFMLLNSLKGRYEFEITKLWDLPKSWKFENWTKAFKYLFVGKVSFVEMIWNSLWKLSTATMPPSGIWRKPWS